MKKEFNHYYRIIRLIGIPVLAVAFLLINLSVMRNLRGNDESFNSYLSAIGTNEWNDVYFTTRETKLSTTEQLLLKNALQERRVISPNHERSIGGGIIKISGQNCEYELPFTIWENYPNSLILRAPNHPSNDQELLNVASLAEAVN